MRYHLLCLNRRQTQAGKLRLNQNPVDLHAHRGRILERKLRYDPDRPVGSAYMRSMRPRAVPTAHRAFMAALMAVALALRLLSPAGFMPAFDHGAVTIVACPDAEPAAPMSMAHHHHQHGDKAHQQPCPYAAASSTGPLPRTSPALLPTPISPAALPAAALVQTPPAGQHRERPPATGPPAVPA